MITWLIYSNVHFWSKFKLFEKLEIFDLTNKLTTSKFTHSSKYIWLFILSLFLQNFGKIMFYKFLIYQVHVSKTFSWTLQSSVPQPRCEHSKKFVVFEAQLTSSIKIGSEPVYLYVSIEPPLNPSVWQADWAARVDWLRLYEPPVGEI